MLAKEVMDGAAGLLNDTVLSSFTYAAQLPYLRIAAGELQEEMELNNTPATNEVSAAYVIPIGTREIGGSGAPLPVDLIEIQGVYERSSGTTNDFLQMTKVEFLPELSTLTNSLIYWSWQNQTIKFLGANSVVDVRLNYIAAKLGLIASENSEIRIINAKSYLIFRTAALCAQFIGENKSRGDELNIFASQAKDRFLGINTKGRQQIATRRRPFGSSYKSHGNF